MKKFLFIILTILKMAVEATTLEDFIPYNMYNTPREEIEDYYNFAIDNNIPTAGVTTLDEMHVLDRGLKKLFRIYKEETNSHTFYHAFYITKKYGLSKVGDPYFKSNITRDDLSSAARIVPWVDNLYELLDNKPDYGKIEDNPYPMIYQRLYLETDEGLKYLDEAEYYLAFNRPGPTTIGWKIETLQPWSLDDDYGYWFVHYEESEASRTMEEDDKNIKVSHTANRFYINDKGTDIGQIDIKASRPLIDSKMPFRYIILNAFDQNPTTSYVENTEDDLMNFIGLFSKEFQNMINNKNIKISGMKFINGYAKDNNLYHINNKIKKMGVHILEETTEYQVILYDNPISSIGIGFRVDDIYRGTKYNDTCLAEIDWLLTEGSSLMGDSNE